MSKLYLIRGLPGSGKSTLARMFECAHVEADMFHVRGGKYTFDPGEIKAAHAWCKYTAARCLDIGMDVVVSNTFTQAWEIKPYLLMCPDVVLIKCSGTYGNIHGVPKDIIAKMADRWEPIEGEIDDREWGRRYEKTNKA